MKLLPHYFKRIGLFLFFLGFILALDSVREGFTEGYTRAEVENFTHILPEAFRFWGDFTSLSGLLLYVLSRNRTEDEFAQKLRYESAFLLMVLTILVVLILYVFNHEILIEPSMFLALQMIAYLIIRAFKRGIILMKD